MTSMLSQTARHAVVVGAALAVLATSAAPALAATASGASSGARTIYCEACDQPGAGDGTGPGGTADPGWGVSHNIGKGRDEARDHNPPKRAAKH